MLELFKKSPRFFIGAVLVHVVIVVVFGVGFHFKSQERAATAMPESVKVTIIDEKETKRELAKQKAKDKREKKRKKDADRKSKADKKRKEDAKKEKKRLALLEKKEKAAKEKEKEKKKKEQAIEDKRKLEEEKQDKAKREQALKDQMRAEDEKMKREQEVAVLRKAELKKRQTTIDKYINMIEAKVLRYWVKPPSISKGLVCELRVKLIPSGEVIDIELSKSSGDPVYDQSVTSAVRKASPLPLPPADSGLFDVFRNLHLPMRADKKT